MNAPELTPEESTQLAEMLAELHARGYQTVDQHGPLRVGTRIRHCGQQYPQAYEHGTGNVVAITHKPNSGWSQSWNMADVELIAVWDEPRFGSRLSQLAQYHVEAVNVEVTS